MPEHVAPTSPAGEHPRAPLGAPPGARRPPVGLDAFAAAQRASLVRLAWALGGELDLAEDLAHEALARVARRWDHVEDPAAYVRTVIVNELRSRWRRAGRERSALARLAGREPRAVAMSLPSHDVWRAVRALPARQRAALVLVVLEDRTHIAAAEVLGCDAETVRTHVRRAKARLALALAGWIEEDR